MNPFASIWLSPRKTVENLRAEEGLGIRLAIIWAWGTVYALDRSGGRMAGWPFAAQVIFPVVIGLFGGAFYFYSLAFAIEVTGSWFGGKATQPQIRGALIFGSIPSVFSLVGHLALIWIFGHEYFENVDLPEGESDYVAGCYYATLTLMVALTIWTVFTRAHALAQVQGYQSAWRAWFHSVVAYILIMLVVAVPLILWMLAIR